MAITQTPSRGQTIGLMAGLMTAVLLTLMDQTVVSTALPTIVGQLGGLELYAWVFSAYMLAQTSFLAIFGKLSDLYGRRLMFLLGVGFFTLGSVLCGQARTMEQLILFRGLQGVGGAGLMPTALAILGVHYGPRERARLQGILGSVAGLAVVLGPLLGSYIVEHTTWRWVFYVNLPLGLLAVLLVVIFLGESRDTSKVPSIDYLGALTLIGWVVSLMLAFISARDHPWLSPGPILFLITFALLLAFFVINEIRAREPILPLEIFRHPTVSATAAVALIRAVAFYSLVIYVPLIVQGVLGGTSENARNALTTFAVPVILGAVVAGFLVGRNLGYRTLLVAGLVLFGIGLWLVARIGVDTRQTQLLPILALAGVGVGVTQVTIVLALQNSVPVEYMGTASSLSQFFTNLAGTVGVGLLGTYQANVLTKEVQSILASATLGKLPPAALQILRDGAALSRALISPEMAARIPPQILAALRGALASSLQSTFMVGLLLTAAALVVSLIVRGSASQPAGQLSVSGGSPVDSAGTGGGQAG